MQYSRFMLEEHETFVEWLAGLDDEVARAAVVRRLDRLRRGHVGTVQAAGRGVFVLPVEAAPGHRVFVHRSGAMVTVLHGAAV